MGVVVWVEVVVQSDKFVVLDESLEVIVLDVLAVGVQSGLIGNLMRDELGVVSRKQWLVDALLLLWVLEQVGVYKLGHLKVVGKDVNRQINALSNSDELITFIVLNLVLLTFGDLVLGVGGSLEGGNWSDPLLQCLVVPDVLDSEASVLLAEELAESEGMSIGLVKLKRVQDESIIVFFEQLNFEVLVAVLEHVMEERTTKTNLADESLKGLAHHEGWEVNLVVLVGSLHMV